MDWLYLVVSLELCFSIIFISSLFYLFLFYKKHKAKSEDAFKKLVDNGYLKNGDYAFYDSLDFWGFGFKVSILNMLLKGKSFKVKDGRFLDQKARLFLTENSADDFSWVTRFYRIFKVQALIVALFAIFLLLSKQMGV